MKQLLRFDYLLQMIQLYSYRLPGRSLGMRFGNKIMDFRMKYLLGKVNSHDENC